MEFLYRNATPVYKGIHPQPNTSFPMGIVSSVFASGTPCYRTACSNGASAPEPARSWWRAWNLTPVYKVASTCVEAPEEPAGDAGAAPSADACANAND